MNEVAIASSSFHVSATPSIFVCATSSSATQSQPNENPSSNSPLLSSYIRPVEISPIPSASHNTSVSRKRKHEGSQILTSSPYLNDKIAKATETKQLESRLAAQRARKKLCLGDDTDEDVEFEANDDDDDVPCLYCNDLFSHSKPKETWLKCIKCGKWAHSECAGVSKRSKMFTCELCKF